jgi:hypothetical protein
VHLPSQLRAASSLTATVDGASATVTRDGEDAVLTLTPTAGQPLAWSVR